MGKYGVRIIHIESLLAVEVNDYLCTFYVEVKLSGNKIYGFSVRNAKVLKQMIKPNL